MGYTHKTDLTFAQFFWAKMREDSKDVSSGQCFYICVNWDEHLCRREGVCHCLFLPLRLCEHEPCSESMRLDLNKYLVSCELWGSSLLTDDVASGFTGTR